MRWRLAVLCVAVALLGACSKTPERYGSANAVATALRAEGITCADFSAGEAAELLKDRGTCAGDDSTIDIYVFGSKADRDRWLRLGAGLDDVMVGPNWVVVTTRDGPF